MAACNDKTLRLFFPQWQGDNNPPYHCGARLLSWLAPEPTGPVEEVPVPLPTEQSLQVEDGVVARAALLEQLRQARRLIDQHDPDRLVVLGGDCLVDLAPFAAIADVVGLGIAEHLPWDALALKNMLARLPLIGTPTATFRGSFRARP